MCVLDPGFYNITYFQTAEKYEVMYHNIKCFAEFFSNSEKYWNEIKHIQNLK